MIVGARAASGTLVKWLSVQRKAELLESHYFNKNPKLELKPTSKLFLIVNHFIPNSNRRKKNS